MLICCSPLEAGPLHSPDTRRSEVATALPISLIQWNVDERGSLPLRH
jgi:hypothetical protein